MIRLSLVLLAGLITAMLVWGTETPRMQTEAIATSVLDAPAPSPAVDIVPAVAVAEPAEPEPEGPVDVARLEIPRLTDVRAASGLLVFQAADAPPDAALPRSASDRAAVLVVTGSSVNMRAGPSNSRAIVGRMRRGERAELVAQATEGWVQVRAASSGRVGYMAARFLKPSQ